MHNFTKIALPFSFFMFLFILSCVGIGITSLVHVPNSQSNNR